MNDQAKRWTADSDVVCRDGYIMADCAGNNAIAARLAACADLLRGVGDLDGVAVMTWADVEKVREIGRRLRARTDALKDPEAYVAIHELMDSLPVPPKGDCK